MHTLGKLGCFTFLQSIGLFFSIITIFCNLNYIEEKTSVAILLAISCATVSLSVTLAWLFCHKETFKVAWRAHLLGVILSFGISVNVYGSEQYFSMSWYICIMAMFHFSEFVVCSIIRPENLSTDSFLLNHSKAYFLAAATSWCEYCIEMWLFPGFKAESYWVSCIGLFMCLGGEGLRKLAMLTASSNFDHLIRTRREEKHTLVTYGIYGLCRHPSYVGWFYWSIGTQIILCNPLCCIAYTLVSWRFFYERIFEEEMTLLHFFGHEYSAYQSHVKTGLPFIEGYLIS